MSSSTSSSSSTVNKANIDISQTPTYGQFVLDSIQYFTENFKSLKTYNFNDFQRDLKLCSDRMSMTDIYLIISLTIFWTFARFWSTKYVFKPLTEYFQLSKSDANKMPESAWKFLFYLGTWTSMAYIMLIKKNSSFFYNPAIVWQNYSLDETIDRDIYVLYLVELSFYLHSLYSTLRVDQWRKDSPTLMVHHILTALLLMLSLLTKTHKSGLFVMFLHDGCDILLEATKMTRYFRIQNGKFVKHMDLATNVGFGCFIFVWVYCRLYCYPLKQIYFASVYANARQYRVPFLLPINIMLWIILIMNFYWFTFILKLLYKVITGQIKEIDDNREYSDDKRIDVSDELINGQINEQLNGRYYLRQRKINYNLLHTGRSE